MTAVHTNGVLVQGIDVTKQVPIGQPYVYFADMLIPYKPPTVSE